MSNLWAAKSDCLPPVGDFGRLRRNAAADAVELGAFFDNQSGGGDVAANVRGAAEDELFAREDVAFYCPIDLRHRDLNDSFRHLRAGAHDQSAVR